MKIIYNSSHKAISIPVFLQFVLSKNMKLLYDNDKAFEWLNHEFVFLWIMFLDCERRNPDEMNTNSGRICSLHIKDFFLLLVCLHLFDSWQWLTGYGER